MSTSTRKPTYRRNIYPPPNRIDGTINAPPLQLQLVEIPREDGSNMHNDSSVVPSVEPSMQARTEKTDTLSNPNTTTRMRTTDPIVPQETPTGACPIINHSFIDVNDCRPAPPRRKPISQAPRSDVSENRSPDRATTAMTTATFIVID